MSFLEAFRIAVKSLLANKIRTFLTTLGIVIGLFAVITLVSMGEGAKDYVLSQISSWGMGTNFIAIEPGKEETEMPRYTLTYQDIDAVASLPHIQYIAPATTGTTTIKYGKIKYKPLYTMGTNADYPLAVNHHVAEGNFFSARDIEGRRKACVIGRTVSKKLFGNSSPIGEKIKINGIGFIIAGVFKEKGLILTMDMDDLVIIPVTLSENIFGTEKIVEAYVTIDTIENVPLVMENIRQLLIKRHKGEEDFRFYTQQGAIDLYNNILNVLTGLVSSIAAISLFVGGIGIMNIMLVSVTERTREIGIRKAIGAKQSDLFWQFIVESILISLVGAVFGIILGTLSAYGIMAYLQLKAVIAYWATFYACIVAVLVGLFFGVYPAMRAARMDPVEALRYEL